MARRARLHDDRCGLAGYLHGRQDKASGRFLAVVWENLADPIITGRGEIGHPKLHAEIAEPCLSDGAQICAAGWMGFRFLDLTVSEVRDAPPSATKPPLGWNADAEICPAHRHTGANGIASGDAHAGR